MALKSRRVAAIESRMELIEGLDHVMGKRGHEIRPLYHVAEASSGQKNHM
jgi:hypothetical protein